MDTLYDFFFSEKFCFYRYVGRQLCRFSAREAVGTLWVWLITGAGLLARAILLMHGCTQLSTSQAYAIYDSDQAPLNFLLPPLYKRRKLGGEGGSPSP